MPFTLPTRTCSRAAGENALFRSFANFSRLDLLPVDVARRRLVPPPHEKTQVMANVLMDNRLTDSTEKYRPPDR